MKILNGKRFIDVISGADSFTRMMAYPPADSGERMLFLEQLKGFPVFSGIYEGDKALDAYMGGTGGLARSRSPLAYSESTRNGLGILLVYSLPF